MSIWQSMGTEEGTDLELGAMLFVKTNIPITLLSFETANDV